VFSVTHFVPRPPEPDAWVQVAYFTRTDETGIYFCGLNLDRPYSEEEIKQRVAANTVEELPVQVPIMKGKTVWISPDCDIWVAAEDDPLNDAHKVRVKKGDGPIGGYRVEKSIVERVGSRVDKITNRKQLVTINKKYVPGGPYEDLARLIASKLCELHNADEKPCYEKPIRWDLIPSFLIEGLFDFCYDPYFRTTSRGESVNVVQIGWIEDMTIVVAKTSPIYTEMVKCRTKNYSLRETLIHCNNEVDIDKIAVLGEVVSATEIIAQVQDNYGISKLIESMRDEVEMLHWVEEEPDRRMIVSDIGFVRMLKRVSKQDIEKNRYPVPKSFGTVIYSANDEITKFKMSKRYPVGFVCPLRDIRWKEEIEKAFIAALRDLAQTSSLLWDKQHGDGIGKELSEVGVEVIPLREICERYKAMDVHDLYIEQLKQEIDRAVEREEYELANQIKKELEHQRI